MLALPPVLRRYYPEVDSTVPGRPWWFALNGALRRRDGLTVGRATASEGWRLPFVDLSAAPASTLSTDYAAAAWDVHQPMPFPGYRTGQVWALVRPDGVVFTHSLLAGDQRAAIPAAFHIAYNGSMAVWGEDYLRKHLAGAFLLADACCPQYAPWAPQEMP